MVQCFLEIGTLSENHRGDHDIEVATCYDSSQLKMTEREIVIDFDARCIIIICVNYNDM